MFNAIISDDTDRSGKSTAGFECGGDLGGCGTGFPRASSASRLRNLDEMATTPASCRYNEIRNQLSYNGYDVKLGYPLKDDS